MNDMEYSFKKIMEVTDIKLNHEVWISNSEYSGCFQYLRENFSVDTALYKHLVGRDKK